MVFLYPRNDSRKSALDHIVRKDWLRFCSSRGIAYKLTKYLRWAFAFRLFFELLNVAVGSKLTPSGGRAEADEGSYTVKLFTIDKNTCNAIADCSVSSKPFTYGFRSVREHVSDVTVITNQIRSLSSTGFDCLHWPSSITRILVKVYRSAHRKECIHPNLVTRLSVVFIILNENIDGSLLTVFVFYLQAGNSNVT